MTTFLLDSNVLIALTAREHVQHQAASRWAAGVESFALCPIVEGSLIRFAVRLGATGVEARRALELVRERPGYRFWPDTLSYSEARLEHVHGHREVTDAYLASLAGSHDDAGLATFDQALVGAFPTVAHLVPTS